MSRKKGDFRRVRRGAGGPGGTGGGVGGVDPSVVADVTVTRRASLAMMFKLARSAEKHWRRLNGHTP